ncbi:hypothetical protein Syun_026678 [Stephania yunnanensis]|uniref:Uncharacterized protein n=1 Tax=Stephania yunnanensis TaxID=152371 RepID=A0AAP0EZJ1_9MAGN
MQLSLVSITLSSFLFFSRVVSSMVSLFFAHKLSCLLFILVVVGCKVTLQ